MAKAAQITFKDFRTRFETEDDCRDYLFRERFPNGFICPKCGSHELRCVIASRLDAVNTEQRDQLNELIDAVRALD